MDTSIICRDYILIWVWSPGLTLPCSCLDSDMLGNACWILQGNFSDSPLASMVGHSAEMLVRCSLDNLR